MAIATHDGWVAAAKQRVVWKKTAARTTVANRWFSMFELAGLPGAGTLAIGNTANGVVHTDATAGYPTINAFGGAATGYLGRVEVFNSVISRIRLFDRLFSAGAYAFNANTNLAAQPSFLGRVPGGTAALCAGCTELWVEQVTTATGVQNVNVRYTNEAGTAGKQTGATAPSTAPTPGSMWQLPLAAGDKGVSLVENVTGTVASAGTFNVHVMRTLFDIRIPVANGGEVWDYLRTGMPILFDTSALFIAVMADSTSSGLPDVQLDIVNG